jgi:hypothetical protein
MESEVMQLFEGLKMIRELPWSFPPAFRALFANQKTAGGAKGPARPGPGDKKRKTKEKPKLLSQHCICLTDNARVAKSTELSA